MKDRNTEKNLIENDLIYSPIGVSKGLRHAMMFACYPPFNLEMKKILIVGGGNNYEGIHFALKGYDVTSIDLFHPRVKILEGKNVYGIAQALPFKDKTFDLYFCCETLEHIPEGYIEDIFDECRRVSKKCLFSIATNNDGEFKSHITIHDGTWWIQKFEDHGFDILNAQINQIVPFTVDNSRFSVSGIYFYPTGVSIYANC